MANKKLIEVIIAFASGILLVASIPIRELAGLTLVSDICRVIGFILLLISIVNRFRK